MTSLWQRISPFGPRAEGIKPGVYHYQAPPDAAVPFRLHLRVEPDGSSLLIINASTVLHLNTSATAHAYELVQGIPDEQAASDIASRYRVGRGRALTDHQQLKDRILMLAEHPHLDPEVYLGIERSEPFSAATTAPYRLDLALTYTTDPDGAQDATARKRVDRELSTDEWKSILSKAWEAGIPHVTFTGGEPTRRPDLADLIAHAQSLGQVTGLLTEGHRLADAAYLNRLEQAGLDHMLITMLVDDPSSMAGLRAAIASPVFAAVHLTLAPDTTDRAIGVLRQLKEMGVTAISLSATQAGDKMANALAAARDQTAKLGMTLMWNLPAPYSATNPIRFELDTTPEGAGKAWLYVEPDGDVLPGQGVDRVLGNMLRDAWAGIWAKAQS